MIGSKMKVNIIGYPTNWKELVWTAARTCYSEEAPMDILNKFKGEDDEHWLDEVTKSVVVMKKINSLAFPQPNKEFEGLYNHLFKSGHHSVFEHLQFTFAVEGVTRQTTHQLVRHRHFSFSQQSMRYVNMQNAHMDIPNGEDGSFEEDIGYETERYVKEVYEKLISIGIHQEDARRAMPIGTLTNIIFSANLRALIDFCSVRRCVLAQKEIHELANTIRREVYKIDPLLGRVLMIKCEKSGTCPEERNKDNKVCGIRPHIDSLNLKTLNILRDDK